MFKDITHNSDLPHEFFFLLLQNLNYDFILLITSKTHSCPSTKFHQNNSLFNPIHRNMLEILKKFCFVCSFVFVCTPLVSKIQFFDMLLRKLMMFCYKVRYKLFWQSMCTKPRLENCAIFQTAILRYFCINCEIRQGINAPRDIRAGYF